MRFIGGFVGLTVIGGEFITPQIGWAVAEKMAEKKKKKKMSFMLDYIPSEYNFDYRKKNFGNNINSI
jgi:hypothetical protein